MRRWIAQKLFGTHFAYLKDHEGSVSIRPVSFDPWGEAVVTSPGGSSTYVLLKDGSAANRSYKNLPGKWKPYGDWGKIKANSEFAQWLVAKDEK